jgi:hypothetical protein
LARFDAMIFSRGAAVALPNPIERAQRSATTPMDHRDARHVCELASIRRKKACDSPMCWLRTDKVFVYFTNMKKRECKQRSPHGTLIHTYAQDHTVFAQPSCLTRFRAGRFFV